MPYIVGTNVENTKTDSKIPWYIHKDLEKNKDSERAIPWQLIKGLDQDSPTKGLSND